MTARLCSVEGCTAKHHALGLCYNHYFKHYRNQPGYKKKIKSPRFLEISRARERRRYYREKSNPKRTIKKHAYAAVHAQILKGLLIPQPCEKCGAKAHAHHDSYLPDDWLKVRWLCPQHHSDWHAANTPIYPAILS